MPRTLDHFDSLKALLRLDRNAQEAELRDAAASMPLAEREGRGWVWLDVEAREEAVGLGGRTLVTVERPPGRPFLAPLHPGDLVDVRPRKAEVDAPPVATVSRATRFTAQLAFERPPPPFVAEGRLRLDLVPNDATYDRTARALDRWKGMDRGLERDRRERLLGNQPARFERVTALEPSRPLNPEQALAVGRALSAQDFFLVHGPPGTGKSTVLSEIAVQAVRQGKRVLCTAASNAAVDHLLECCLAEGLEALRVGHPARVAERLVQHTLDVRIEEHPDRILSRELFDEALDLLGHARRQRSQGRSRDRFANARDSKAQARQLFDDARALEKKAMRSLLDRAQVLCATLASLGGAALSGETFDLALIDEATQATEPLSLIAMLRAPVSILAGDHRQLPPTVLSQQAVKGGLSVSLFERLLGDGGDAVGAMLLEQHRMSEALMLFPSRETYGGRLRAHPNVAAHRLETSLDAPPLLFLDTAGKGFEEEQHAEDKSLFNSGEAGLVKARVKELLAAGIAAQEMGVITPYSAQSLHLREELASVPGAEEVEIDTVDAFQGREKDVILVTFTRSNAKGELGFLKDLRRVNVALTRARRHLFLVGDSGTLASHPFYARLIEHAQSTGGYRSAWDG